MDAAKEVKRRLASGNYILVAQEKESEVWKQFDIVHNKNN